MIRFLVFCKKDDKYTFKYKEGNEKNLYLTLIESGKNPGLNLTLIESLKLIKIINKHIQEVGYTDSSILKLPTRNKPEDYRKAS